MSKNIEKFLRHNNDIRLQLRYYYLLLNVLNAYCIHICVIMALELRHDKIKLLSIIILPH